MKKVLPFALALTTAVIAGDCTSRQRPTNTEKIESDTMITNDSNSTEEKFVDNKLVVYQIFTRLFGNKVTANQYFGTRDENGVGKFNDVTGVALQELKKLGITHVWYTGVIEHATMTDYRPFGIPPDDADVVKGRAGSPYAIKDYYDVDPDLAVDVPHRMAEFEALVGRTHDNGLKLFIDFVPNHVARHYHSDAKPAGVEDLGEKDDTSRPFDPNNSFYYLPGQTLKVPKGNNPLADALGPGEDGGFLEFPAKATGNDVFSADPSINDWYETIKLNYGVDYQNQRTKHFYPFPATWNKMHDILAFWTNKGVDGFRCDMAEMVPVEFWAWVIPKIRQINPEIKFTAEIYNPKEYRNYLSQGQFDFLYDKVGLYDTLRRLMEGHGNAEGITQCWKHESRGIATHMWRFLENHDEQRVASREFANNPWAAVPAMTVSATLGPGPVMVYFGQEVGEKGEGNEGFGTEDGRTTIFDYWGVPAHQQWMNGGKFDGGLLSDDQRRLRQFYATLLNLCNQQEAIRKGAFYSLQAANEHRKSEGFNGYLNYAYLRFTPDEQLLILVNFDQTHAHRSYLKIPPAAWAAMGLDGKANYALTDLLGDNPRLSLASPATVDLNNPEAGVEVSLPTWGAAIYRIEKQ